MARPRTAPLILSEDSPFSIGRFIGLIVRALLAYVFAFWIYVFIARLTHVPTFAWMDEGSRAAVFFAALVLAIAGLLMVLMQPIWGSETRGFGLMISIILVGIALTQALGLTHINPLADPIELIRTYFFHGFPRRL